MPRRCCRGVCMRWRVFSWARFLLWVCRHPGGERGDQLSGTARTAGSAVHRPSMLRSWPSWFARRGMVAPDGGMLHQGRTEGDEAWLRLGPSGMPNWLLLRGIAVLLGERNDGCCPLLAARWPIPPGLQGPGVAPLYLRMMVPSARRHRCRRDHIDASSARLCPDPVAARTGVTRPTLLQSWSQDEPTPCALRPGGPPSPRRRTSRRLFELAGLEAEPAGLALWLPRGVALLAAALVGLGLVLWVAANWDALGRVAQFALVQGLVAAACLGAAALPSARPALGLLALLAIGGLLAYFGQTYQTGADAWQLFALWGLLALPLALAVRSDALWTPWALVAMTAITLWAQAHASRSWLWSGAAGPDDLLVHASAWGSAALVVAALSPALRRYHRGRGLGPAHGGDPGGGPGDPLGPGWALLQRTGGALLAGAAGPRRGGAGPGPAAGLRGRDPECRGPGARHPAGGGPGRIGCFEGTVFESP